MQTITAERGRPATLGATPEADGVQFAVFSDHAERIELCLFEAAGTVEAQRLTLPGRGDGGVHYGFVPGLRAGTLYGYRAQGPFDPANGYRFDASKLLVDPYATRIDRPFLYHPTLAAPPSRAIDTAPLVPRAVVEGAEAPAEPLPFRRPGFTYELLVRAYTQRHPLVPERLRGTVAALAEPAVLDHLTRLGVETVELMPLAAALDERHLSALGLTNAWGYNPVTHMAPDPRLAPGGWAEIRRTVEALHACGIRVLLDVVLNHSGESDRFGPTIAYRGLDNRTYYAAAPGDHDTLVNDTGTGNTFALWREPVAQMAVDALRTWVTRAGIDGFRYDLAPILGRTPEGFRPDAPFFRMLAADPVLAGRIHVAEPWDIGPGGYQVGRFPRPFLEWQDRFRDDVRRFWRGEDGMVGPLATRLSGSPDLFAGEGRTPGDGVNFIDAHDGFSLADLVAYAERHNEANGENNRDGHADNHSWNNGVEGATSDSSIIEARRRDVRALLATLMVARGTPMIVAGDEMGRTQGGNNNGYAQDNEVLWLDWAGADEDLVAFTARLVALRAAEPALHADRFLTGADCGGMPDVVWLGEDGAPMRERDWRDGERRWLAARLAGGPSETPGDRGGAEPARGVLVYLNADRQARTVRLPPLGAGLAYRLELQSDRPDLGPRPLDPASSLTVTPRAVFVVREVAAEATLQPDRDRPGA